jgi:hypothetical protein
MTDLIGYFTSPTGKYRNIVFIIYNASGTTLDSSIARDLKKNGRVLEVVEMFP